MKFNAKRRVRILTAALRGDTSSRFLISEQLDYRLNRGHFFGEQGAVWYTLAPDIIPVARFGSWNLHRRWDRLWNLRQFAQLVKNVEGDTIEFGCHAGASSFIILQVLEAGNHWCVDSFQGLSNPDPRLDGQDWEVGDLAISEDVLKSNLEEFHARLHVVKGWIPEVLQQLPENLKFRLAHIDVDLYEPTRASLEYVAPRMVPGSVIVCDDYGSSGCPGARKALDDFVAEHRDWALIHLSSTQAVLLARPGRGHLPTPDKLPR